MKAGANLALTRMFSNSNVIGLMNQWINWWFMKLFIMESSKISSFGSFYCLSHLSFVVIFACTEPLCHWFYILNKFFTKSKKGIKKNNAITFFMEMGLNPSPFLTLLQKFMLHIQSETGYGYASTISHISLQFPICLIQDTHKNSTPR